MLKVRTLATKPPCQAHNFFMFSNVMTTSLQTVKFCLYCVDSVTLMDTAVALSFVFLHGILQIVLMKDQGTSHKEPSFYLFNTLTQVWSGDMALKVSYIHYLKVAFNGVLASIK